MRRKERIVIQQGNSPHVRTDRMAIEVERMVFCGLSVEEISYVTGLSKVTLESQYSGELDHGAAMVLHQVGNAQIKAALRGDSNAAQFLLRARARWVTPTKAEIDTTVTIQDKRKVMDEILVLVKQSQRAAQKVLPPITIDAAPTGKPS